MIKIIKFVIACAMVFTSGIVMYNNSNVTVKNETQNATTWSSDNNISEISKTEVPLPTLNNIDTNTFTQQVIKTPTNENKIIDSNLTTPIIEQPQIISTETIKDEIENDPEIIIENESTYEPIIIKDKKLVTIGDITIMDDFSKMENMYREYFIKEENGTDCLFFNGGSGQYGDFIASVKLTNTSINSITFSQWNNHSVLTMNLGDIKIGDHKDILLDVYGKWDKEEVNWDVKQLIYHHFVYEGMPLTMIIYLDPKTDIIYGYEIFVK